MPNVPCSEDDDIGVQLAAVLELEPGLRKLLDLAVVLQLDLAVDDHLRRADVEVVTTAAATCVREEAGAIVSEVQLEASLLETLEELPVCAVR